jgi:hypothetical protein
MLTVIVPIPVERKVYVVNVSIIIVRWGNFLPVSFQMISKRPMIGRLNGSSRSINNVAPGGKG